MSQISTDDTPNRHWELERLDAAKRRELISGLKRMAARPGSLPYYFQATQIIQEGDLATVSRSPKHHAGNGVVSRVRAVGGSTIRVPTAAWKLAAGDFDGDNPDVFVPRGIEARAEAQELHGPHRVVAATGAGRVDVMPSPNCILGLYTLTDPRRRLSPQETIRFYRSAAGAIATRKREAFEELAEERLHVDVGPWLPVGGRSATWMRDAVARIGGSPRAWEACVAELLSLCIPVGMDADVAERHEAHRITSPVWRFYATGTAPDLLLGLLPEDGYVVLSIDDDGAVREGLLCPAPDEARAARLRAVGVFEGCRGEGGGLRTTLCRGMAPHRLERICLQVRRGRFEAPVPRLTGDTIQELYNHVLYCGQGRAVVACIDCLEQLAVEASRWLGVVAGSPMDFANAARRRSPPVSGMRLVSERAMEGDRYLPPTEEGGLFRGGVATCVEAGLKGTKKQLLEMGVSIGHVTGRHGEAGRTITARYMDGLDDYDDFVANQQKAIRSEIEGKSSISEVGYQVKKLLFEYLSLVAGHRGEVLHLAGKGGRRMVERHFGGDGLDASKLIREARDGQGRVAVNLDVAMELARRWRLPAPLDGEDASGYLERVYVELRWSGGEPLAAALEDLWRPPSSRSPPGAILAVVRRCLGRVLPPWRVQRAEESVVSAFPRLPTLGNWIGFVCVVLRRLEYARIEYGCPVGGQAVEVLMMAIQQAALDSKHGVGVTAEDRLEDLIVRAAPPKRMTIRLRGNVPGDCFAPEDKDPLGEALVARREVYPAARVGRQADGLPWGAMRESMQNACGVGLRLEFAPEAREEAWRRIEEHALARALPSPFELRAERGDAGCIDVVVGLAEPPMHMALREVYAAYTTRSVQVGEATPAVFEALSEAAVTSLRGWGSLGRPQLIDSAETLVRTCFSGLSPQKWWQMLVANGEEDSFTERETRREQGEVITRDLRTGHPRAVEEAPGQEDLAVVFATAMERSMPGLRQAVSAAVTTAPRRGPSLMEQCQRRVRGEVEQILERRVPPESWDARSGVEIRHSEEWTEVTTETVAGEARAAPLLELAEKLSGPRLDAAAAALAPEAMERYLQEGGEIPSFLPTVDPRLRGLYCDSPATAEAALGLEEGRRSLLRELDELFPDADPRHARLLASMSVLDGHQRGLRRCEVQRSPLELALYEAPRDALTRAALSHHKGVEGSPVVDAARGVAINVGTGVIAVDLGKEAEEEERGAMAEIVSVPEEGGGQRKRRNSGASAFALAPQRAWRGPGVINV